MLKPSQEQGVLSSGHCSRCSIVSVSVSQLHEGRSCISDGEKRCVRTQPEASKTILGYCIFTFVYQVALLSES